MGGALLAPLALFGLLSLLLPLALHLRRQVRRSPMDFAALRWLQPRLRPRARWRIERPWLLLLRLLLAALLVLLLAEPVWRQPRSGDALLVHPAVDATAVQAAALPGRQLHWWAPGFPTLDHSPPAAELASASLLRQFDAELAVDAALQVWLPEQAEIADGQLPQLRRPVDWVTRPAALLVEPAAAAAPLRVWWIDTGSGDDQPWLRAALQTLAQPHGQETARLVFEETAEATLPEGPARPGETLVWNGEQMPPESILQRLRDGAQLWWARPCSDCQPAAGWSMRWRATGAEPALWQREVGLGRMLRLDVAMTPAQLPQLLEADFPQRLFDWLQPLPVASRIDAAVLAELDEDGVGLPAIPTSLPQEVPLGPPLALLLVLLWLLERFCAGWRRAAEGGQ